MWSYLIIGLLLARRGNPLPEIQISKQTSSNAGDPAAKRLFRRGGVVGTNVGSALSAAVGGGYFVTVSVGNPPQPQQLQLETAASDTYLVGADLCSKLVDQYDPCRGHSFSSSASDSFEIVSPSPAFSLVYADGSTVSGSFGRDTIELGGLAINNVEFGIAENASSTSGFSYGSLGLGYSAEEAEGPQAYPNLPDILKESGAINSRLYSLYLNEFSSSSGGILFGGIDKSKYSGELATLDLLPSYYYPGMIADFITTVTSLAVSEGSSGVQQTLFASNSQVGGSQPGGGAWAVDLCVGCSNWEIPSRYYQQLINSTFDFVDSNGQCSCDHRSDNHSLQISFGGEVTISVPARDFIVPLYNSTEQPQSYTDGTDSCFFAISDGSASNASSGSFVLGEAVLRSMYLVFDLDNGQISIAQAVVNSTAPPDIHTVAAGPSGVAVAIGSVQTAASNTYSIATAASANVTFSTSSISSSSASTIGGGTVTSILGGVSPSTVSPAAVPTTSKGAGMSVVPQSNGWKGLWTLVGVPLVATLMMTL